MVRINSMQMRWSFLSDFKDSINSIDLSYVKMNNIIQKLKSYLKIHLSLSRLICYIE